jgi:hypothetical protein
LSDDVVFPKPDRFYDHVTISVQSESDVRSLKVALVGPDDSTRYLYSSSSGELHVIRFNGLKNGKILPPGQYTVRATVADSAGSSAVSERPLQIDNRRVRLRTYRATIPAARTVADQYVGACSRIGSATGRGWKDSLGLYSTTPCAKKGGSTVITVHGAWLPPSALGYKEGVQLTMHGGAARGSGRAYVIHGWLRASDNKFIHRQQFSGALGPHAAGAPIGQVVRTIGDDSWVYWQLGLSEGSRYDVKSFTISTKYYVLVSPPRSSTASDAKTIAEPSGAPGPGYTVPNTDAAELLAAYSPSM